MSPYLPTAAELFEEMELLSWLEQDRATPIALVRKPGAARPCVAKALFPEIKQDERALSRFCNEIFLTLTPIKICFRTLFKLVL